jgi:hypothetical protein
VGIGMTVQSSAAALKLLQAGGVLRGDTIQMPDGTIHECWRQVALTLGNRKLITRSPAGGGWVAKPKAAT